MKILYSHYLTDAGHPAAQMVEAVAKGLGLLGHEVAIHGSDGPWKNVPQARTPIAAERPKMFSRLKTRFWFARGIDSNGHSFDRDLQAIRSFEPEIVLCRSDPYRYSMHRAARRLGVPLVTYVDAPAAYECRGFASDRWHPPRLLEAVEKWCLKRSRAAVTVSRPAKAILDRYGLATPVFAVPNGVDLDRFSSPPPREEAFLRAQFGLSTPMVAGFIGTFQRFHGVSLLAELIEKTADRADLTWLLVGDGPELPRLQAAARINPRVVFAGRQPSARAAKLLGMMDVLVAPHARQLEHFYFCPLKILEGMAAGAVCLASDQGDIPMLLDGGRAGRLVPSDRAEDWLYGLSGLLDDPVLRNDLRCEARMRVEARFTWQSTADRVSQILRNAAAPFVRPVLRSSLERELACKA